VVCMIVFDRLETREHAVFVEIASRKCAIVSWRFRPTNENLAGAVVSVTRSYSPTGPFVAVAEVPGSTTYYRDANALMGDKWREVYYKLRVTSPDGSDESEVVGVRSHPSMEAIAARRRADLALRLEGVPCVIYSRRNEGGRCPACWDAVLKTVSSSRCTSCYNTGRLGGFYSPVLTQVKIMPVAMINEPADTLRQTEQTTGMVSFFPLVKPRDVIYEVNKGKRWRITQVTPTEIHRIPIHQDIVMIGLNPDDVEHSLPIPSGLTTVIPQWKDQRTYLKALVRDYEIMPVEERQGKDPGAVDFTPMGS